MKDQTIVKDIAFNAAITTLWDAITDPEEMKKWYFNIQDFKLVEGNKFYFYEPNGKNFKHVCRILEVVPGERIRYTWSYPEYSKAISVVSWQLTSVDRITHVRLKHSGIENFSSLGPNFESSSFDAGWDAIIMKSLPEFLKSKLY